MKQVCITHRKHAIHILNIDLWMHRFYKFHTDDQVILMLLYFCKHHLQLFRANKEEDYYSVVKLTYWFGVGVLVTIENEDNKSVTLPSMNLGRNTLWRRNRLWCSNMFINIYVMIPGYSLRQFLYQGILC